MPELHLFLNRGSKKAQKVVFARFKVIDLPNNCYSRSNPRSITW